MSQASLKMMQLDHQFAEDHNGEELRRLLGVLAEGRLRLRDRMDAGVAAVDHQRFSTVLEAFEAGIRLLPRLREAQQR
ncbi:MAG: hypothetical protein H6851_01505 [Geminicoccaceae bacterium]|nr:hypothetical protein [Geminicoccaceae bacterium]MCB9942286.1 hypothetical protein [Geminicoccaceae bacterium]